MTQVGDLTRTSREKYRGKKIENETTYAFEKRESKTDLAKKNLHPNLSREGGKRPPRTQTSKDSGPTVPNCTRGLY